MARPNFIFTTGEAATGVAGGAGAGVVVMSGVGVVPKGTPAVVLGISIEQSGPVKPSKHEQFPNRPRHLPL